MHYHFFHKKRASFFIVVQIDNQPYCFARRLRVWMQHTCSTFMTCDRINWPL